MPNYYDLNTGNAPRTEHQISGHEGFRPEAVGSNAAPKWTSEGERTLRLAHPPAWTERGDMPCVIPAGQRGDLARAHADRWDYAKRNAKEADELCKGCPVIEQCLESALEEEAGVSGDYRYLIRGGLLPVDRARLAAEGDVA